MAANQSNPQVSPDETAKYFERQRRLDAILSQAGLDALVLNPGPSLVYLTGLQFHLMERPVLAFFIPGKPITLVTPQLEVAKTNNLPYPVQVHTYGEDPAGWPEVFQRAAEQTGLKGKAGVEPTRIRYLELRLIEPAAPQAKFVSAEASLEKLRMAKDLSEIAMMRRAVEIAQIALERTTSQIKPGLTERQVAAELTQQLLRGRFRSRISFFTHCIGRTEQCKSTCFAIGATTCYW